MINKSRIASDIGLSPDSVEHILNLFFSETHNRIRRVNELTKRSEYSKAREIIHQLLGSCAYCRFDALECALSELNRAIKTEEELIPSKIEKVNQLYSLLEREHESV